MSDLDHEKPSRRMRGSHLSVHLRWARALDRLSSTAGGPEHRSSAGVVLISDALARQAVARLRAS